MLFVGVEPNALLNFRGELLKFLVNSSLSVTTISKPLDKNQKIKLESLSVDSEQVDFSRNGLNPATDLKTLFNLFLK